MIRFAAFQILAVWLMCNGPPAVAGQLHPVITQAIERQESYQAVRVFAGRVLGSQRANIAFEFPGRVEAVLIEDGARVVAGQVLARLDRRALEIEKAELAAQEREITVGLQRLQRDLARYLALAEKGYVSEGKMDELRTQQQAVSAQLVQVESRLEGVELRLTQSVLKAPFPGEVADLRVEEGVVVAAGQSVMELVEVGNSEAVFGVSAEAGDNLRLGQSLTVLSDGGTFQGDVVAIANKLDWRSQTRNIRLALPGRAPVVDGSTVYVHIPVDRPGSGFWLPRTALVEDLRGTWAVYALAPAAAGYQLRKHSVEVLYFHRGRAFLSAGLPDRTQVVTAGTHQLVPGQMVRLAQ